MPALRIIPRLPWSVLPNATANSALLTPLAIMNAPKIARYLPYTDYFAINNGYHFFYAIPGVRITRIIAIRQDNPFAYDDFSFANHADPPLLGHITYVSCLTHPLCPQQSRYRRR
jgi:hypothetical protein